MIIRDPVVVTATLPRFLDLGDRSQMHVDIDNVAGERRRLSGSTSTFMVRSPRKPTR